MTSITIDRAKYRHKKGEINWLGKFIDEQVKETGEKTVVIKEKEVKTKVSHIVPEKLFLLAEKNGVRMPKIAAAVDEKQQGAIGRGRMILTGCLKRNIAAGKELFDTDGDAVVIDEDYRASVTPAVKPTEAVAA